MTTYRHLDAIIEKRPMPIGKLNFDDYAWLRESTSFIGTMPRSGTNLVVYFLDFLHQAIIGSLDEDNPKVYKLAHAGWKSSLAKSLDSRFCLVSHNYCPGFEALYSRADRQNWDGIFLERPAEDHNYRAIIDGFKSITYPNLNPKTKIVYIYRNPLDQMLSRSRHTINHINAYRHNMNDPEVLYYYIQSYIKLHFTYVRMNEMYPNNIKFYTYEDIIRSSYTLLTDIASYISGPDCIIHPSSFQRALDLITPSKMKDLELRLNTTLAGDQKTGSHESHIRSTGVYNWHNKYSNNQLHFIESALRKFSFSLTQFDIGESISFDQSKLDENTAHLLRIEDREKNKKYYAVKTANPS